MEAVTQSYVTGGLQKGNIARKELLFKAKEDWQQGGQAYSMQTNSDAVKLYESEVKADFKSGRINKQTRDRALEYSKEQFEGSFDKDGNFNKFEGYQTAEDIYLIEHIDANMQGWVSETMGREVGQFLNGDYYFMDTLEGIPREELLKSVRLAAANDPKAQSYLQQLDFLFDQKDPSKSNSETAINEAMNFLANKYDGLKSNRQVINNWRKQAEYNDRLARKRAKDEKEEEEIPRGDMGTKSSSPFNALNGLTKVEIGEQIDKKILKLQKEKDNYTGSKVNPSGLSVGINPVMTEAQKQRVEKINQEIARLQQSSTASAKVELDWYNSPDGRADYPMVGRVMDNMPRQSINDPSFIGVTGKMASAAGLGNLITRPESDDEYIARVFEVSNAITDNLAQQTTTVIPIPDENYFDVFKRYITQGALLSSGASYLSPELGPSPQQRLKQSLIDAGAEVNGKNAAEATDDEWNTYLGNSTRFNGYIVPGPSAGENTYDLSVGMEVTIDLGGKKGTRNFILDDATDEQNEEARRTERFATSMYAPQSARNDELGSLPVQVYNEKSRIFESVPNSAEGWGAGSVIVPGFGEVVSKTNPLVYQGLVTEKPIIYKVIKTKQGTYLTPAIDIDEESGRIVERLSYDQVIRARSMADRNSRYRTVEQ
jgi:hypothetical protein